MTTTFDMPERRFSVQWLLPCLPPIALLGLWWLVTATAIADLPSPATVLALCGPLFGKAFSVASPSDIGIGWLLCYSLGRVAVGFGCALLVGVPLGLWIGISPKASRAFDPSIQLVKSVSPLAWLPIGLASLHNSELAALFVIFITSLCPIVLNTALGVHSIPKGYWNLAQVLDLPKSTVLRQIIIPATLPNLFTGMRISLGIAWMVIVAAEMLTGAQGIGAFVWNAWNNLDLSLLIVSILIIGLTGIALDQLITKLARRLPKETP